MRVLVAALLVCSVVAFVNMPMKHSFLDGQHHLHRHFSHRRGNAQSPPANFQMGGNIYPVGIYWVAVDIGTPYQSMLAAVDSGSSDLLVPSATCSVRSPSLSRSVLTCWIGMPRAKHWFFRHF
jgi:hypothetical protein